MKYDPKDAVTSWPDGEYTGTLDSVTQTNSKAGDEMEVWQFTVYNHNGKTQTIKEYVTAAVVFKIRNLAKAAGMIKEFEAGTFQAEQVQGWNFLLSLTTESQDGYDDKNKIGRIKSAKTENETSETKPAGPNIADVRKKSLDAAWKTFNVKFAGKSEYEIKMLWKAHFETYFNGQPNTAIGAQQWDKFRTDGFVKQAAVASPFDDTPADDSDFPF